jgi:hypothetical protein
LHKILFQIYINFHNFGIKFSLFIFKCSVADAFENEENYILPTTLGHDIIKIRNLLEDFEFSEGDENYLKYQIELKFDEEDDEAYLDQTKQINVSTTTL